MIRINLNSATFLNFAWVVIATKNYLPPLLLVVSTKISLSMKEIFLEFSGLFDLVNLEVTHSILIKIFKNFLNIIYVQSAKVSLNQNSNCKAPSLVYQQ